MLASLTVCDDLFPSNAGFLALLPAKDGGRVLPRRPRNAAKLSITGSVQKVCLQNFGIPWSPNLSALAWPHF